MYKEEKKTEREKENDLFDKKTKKKKKKKEGRLQQFDVDTQLTYNHRKKTRATDIEDRPSLSVTRDLFCCSPLSLAFFFFCCIDEEEEKNCSRRSVIIR